MPSSRTDDFCLEFFKEQRFSDGMTMLRQMRRGAETPSGYREERPMLAVTAEIRFIRWRERSSRSPPLPLALVSRHVPDGLHSCGISAKQIQRETGVTYKTAWRMFKQIRTLMSEDMQLEGSTVEIDETYVADIARISTSASSRNART